MREAVQKCGHELRNALNGLMVNLEVVRSLLSGTGGETLLTASFLNQAMEQAEVSVRLAEATLTLLDVVVGAVDEAGAFRCEASAENEVRLAASTADAERAVGRLEVLTGAAGVRAEAADSAVILTIRAVARADTN